MASKTGVIYIQRHKFQIYSSALSGVLEFLYVPELVKDMDIADKELFENIVKLFIENNKIPIGNLIIVLGDSACFIKDFTGEDAEKLKAKAEEFVDHTPFENVSSKTFSIGSGIRVFATNKELYEAIEEAFEKSKFTVEAVIPGFLIGDMVGPALDLTPQIANLAVEKLSAVRQYNLLRPDIDLTKDEKSMSEVKGENLNLTIAPAAQGDKKRLVLLIAVFGVLIVALVVVYFINYPIKP